jgi:alpha-1,2-mannosyltransferase
MLIVPRRTPWVVAAGVLKAMILAFMIAGTHGWIVRGVKPTTTDYVSFYAAGRLASGGQSRAAYDHDAHWRMEQAVTAPGVNYQYFFNPPPFLLLMVPLSLPPYLVSFVLFQALTLPFWLWVGTRIAGLGRTGTAWLLAVPSLWWVLGLGQNSFLTAGLLGAGLLLLPTRKLAAGVLFGLLCYKPHLGLLIPVALLAGCEWGALVAAGATVLVCVGATFLLFGVATWTAFLDMARHSVTGAMDSGAVLWAGRIDPTGAFLELGLGVAVARGLWLVCLAVAASCVALVWRRGDPALRAAALAAAIPIAAPFALFYDLILCALAACWLLRAAGRTGFLRAEKSAFPLLILANLLAAPMIVAATHIPFGACVPPALLTLAMRRWWKGCPPPPGRESMSKNSANGLSVNSFIALSKIER